jgi:hypothetical protein
MPETADHSTDEDSLMFANSIEASRHELDVTARVAHCPLSMPDAVCQALELPFGATFAQGAAQVCGWREAGVGPSLHQPTKFEPLSDPEDILKPARLARRLREVQA